MTTIYFGSKNKMSEAFLGEERVAVTRLDLFPMRVAAIKENAKKGTKSTQVVFGREKKHSSKSIMGILKNSGVKSGTIREIPFSEGIQVGQTLSAQDTIKPGTVISIQGTTKGKGFAGVMKRWGFAGGPRTHGQSDRGRAPGSIGQGTTPGRVHRGKKMAGHMGQDTHTTKNVTVVAISGNSIWITGPVPGAIGTQIKITVTGQSEAPKLTFLNGYNPAPVSSENVATVTEEVQS